jgi:hypothetical protein
MDRCTTKLKLVPYNGTLIAALGLLPAGLGLNSAKMCKHLGVVAFRAIQFEALYIANYGFVNLFEYRRDMPPVSDDWQCTLQHLPV